MANNELNAQIDYTKPYITRDEYLKAKGVDLSEELKDNDNKSNKVDTFIKDITDFVMGRLVRDYACNDLNVNVMDFATLKEFRRIRFHEGMIEQIEYILNNGLLHQDSGVLSETGQILDYSSIVISKSALNKFWLGAFCNIPRI